ncbi:MAG: LytTR family DNA-binding domain-containing protein [Bacteroidota bacterium]
MSTKMKAIIVDDESHCIQSLKLQLEYVAPWIEVVEAFQQPAKALEFLSETQPDVVFLDVSMPLLNGFDLLRALNEIRFKVIFTTAHDEYAIQAFRVSALDYLLKPIREADLVSAVQKLKALDSQPQSLQSNVDVLLDAVMQKGQPAQKIALPTLEGFDFVEVRTILRIEADGNYSIVHFDSGKSLVVTRALKEMEEILTAHRFLRIHISHLVNLNKLQKYVRGDGGYVILEGGQQLPVSRSRKQILLDKIQG